MPRTVYNSKTDKEKAKIIQEYESSIMKPKLKDFALKHKIGISTLSGYLANKDKILNNSFIRGSSKKFRFKKPHYELLEKRLFEDFTKMSAHAITSPGVWLKERAQVLAKEMEIPNFGASNKWLKGFKERKGLSLVKACGESAKVDLQLFEEWLEENMDKLQSYAPENIFNADKTGLFYRLLPSRTIAFKGKKCHGGSQSKERITVLLGANMSGQEKLVPLVIGKSAKPRCFPKMTVRQKHYTVRQIGAHYRHQIIAWMSRSLFREWLQNLERKFSTEKRKVLLLLDIFSGHRNLKLKLKHVEVLYFPANTTSVSQAMDQGIIASTKAHYKRNLINYYWSQIKDASEAMQIKPINLLQGIRLMSTSWNSVTSQTISNCFRKSLPGIHEIDSQESEELPEVPSVNRLIIDQLFPANVSIQDYLNADNNLLIGDEEEEGDSDDDTVVDEPNSSDSEMEDHENEEEPEVAETEVTHKQAINALSILLQHSCQADVGTTDSSTFLTNYLNDTIRAYIDQKKQSDIRSYFKPI